jgi:hypothetical protein
MTEFFEDDTYQKIQETPSGAEVRAWFTPKVGRLLRRRFEIVLKTAQRLYPLANVQWEEARGWVESEFIVTMDGKVEAVTPALDFIEGHFKRLKTQSG